MKLYDKVVYLSLSRNVNNDFLLSSSYCYTYEENVERSEPIMIIDKFNSCKIIGLKEIMNEDRPYGPHLIRPALDFLTFIFDRISNPDDYNIMDLSEYNIRDIIIYALNFPRGSWKSLKTLIEEFIGMYRPGEKWFEARQTILSYFPEYIPMLTARDPNDICDFVSNSEWITTELVPVKEWKEFSSTAEAWFFNNPQIIKEYARRNMISEHYSEEMKMRIELERINL